MADDQEQRDSNTDISRRDFVTLSVAAGVALATGNTSEAAVPVIEQNVTIKTQDGTCDAAFIHPTMGAHPGKVLTSVSLPLLVPGIAAAVLLLFGYSFADLGNPLLLGGDFPVLSAEIYQTIIGMYDIPRGAALAIMLLVPAAVLFFLHGRLSSRSAYASVGGRGSMRHPMVRHPLARGAALVLCGVVSLVIVLQYATVLAGASYPTPLAMRPSRMG